MAEPVITTEIKEAQSFIEVPQTIEPVGIDVSDWKEVEEVIQQPVEYNEFRVEEVKPKDTPNIVREVKEEVKKPIQKKDTVAVENIIGSELSYETIIRLIDEYNNSIDNQLNYSVKNRYEVREKAIKCFYENKYNVKLKEKSIFNSKTNMYALVNRKKGMEAAYLLICETLTDAILNYVLDNYDDEVVYFCPIDDVRVDFEVGLNEFYLKDTDIIFDRYLEYYEIVEESDRSIKKLEVIIGSH